MTFRNTKLSKTLLYLFSHAHKIIHGISLKNSKAFSLFFLKRALQNVRNFAPEADGRSNATKSLPALDCCPGNPHENHRIGAIAKRSLSLSLTKNDQTKLDQTAAPAGTRPDRNYAI